MVNIFAIAFLCIGEDILLVRRFNQSFGQGLYSMAGGKVEQGKTARKAIVREVYEEAALDIAESTFELVHTFHRKGAGT